MSTLQDRLARLRLANAAVRRGDAELTEESADLREVREVATSPEAVERAIEQESIVMRRQRPVFAVKKDTAVLEFKDPKDSEIWKDRLTRAEPALTRAARATGRIDIQGGRLDWVGTGWLGLNRRIG